MTNSPSTPLETITLAGGCFWCIEPLFAALKGVQDAVVGYSGGSTPNPTYQQVCTGATRHAEVVQITFDPQTISLHDLLTIFFTMHDPTTLNRQGADVGTQYRSAIFYRTPEQQQMAKAVMAEIEAAKIWMHPIVTEVTPFSVFYPAEEYHQEYYEKNPRQPFCQAVIDPKVAKFRKLFAARLNAG